MKRIIKLRLIIIVISLLPIFLVEISLRVFFNDIIQIKTVPLSKERAVFGLFRSDNYIGWRLIPDLNINLKIPSSHPVPNENNPIFKYNVITNSLGYRTVDFKPQKDKDLFRIICMGDSTTFGWGIGNPLTYPEFLESKLKKAFINKKIEVLNFGVPGYSSRQGLVLLKDEVIPRYSPDLVIIGYGINDVLTAYVPDEFTIHRRNIFYKMDGVLQNFAIYRALKNFSFRLSTKNQNQSSAQLQSRVSKEETQKNLESINELASKNGIKAIYLNMIPSEELKFKVSESKKDDMTSRHEALEDFYNSKDFCHIDIASLLIENFDRVKTDPRFKTRIEFYKEYFGSYVFNSSPMYYLYVDYLHPNSIGNELIADTILEKVIKIGILN
jgi:lysophospholipase L1-like esterase